MNKRSYKNRDLLLRIIRRNEVLHTLSISRSTLFNRIDAGLIPPSIPLGGRAVGWLESEIQAILIAFVGGKEPDDIKELVNDLISARKVRGGMINE